MNNSEILFNEINIQLEELLFHSIGNKYLGEITYDKKQLFWVINALVKSHIPHDEIKTVSIAFILIKTALEIHNHPSISSQKFHDYNRNISILIGDYYSGLYYKTVSSLNNFEIINLLASGIKEINEYKVKLMNEKLSNEMKNKYKQEIETNLIQKICIAYNIKCETYSLLSDYIEQTNY